ncbi:hypothetical protein C8Q80DRAFT_1355464 [Daedaleopsis nitida]|nr:hypothetical protein C8Q80DRAFT_1355464 [Daedaleopsis nitida]
MSNFPRDNFQLSQLALTAGGKRFLVRDSKDDPWRKLTMAELLPMKEAWEAKHRAEVRERVATKIANAETPNFEEMLFTSSTVVVSKPKFKVYVDNDAGAAGLKRQPRVTPLKRKLRSTGVTKAVPEKLPACVAKGLAQRRPTISKPRAPLGTVSNKF